MKFGSTIDEVQPARAPGEAFRYDPDLLHFMDSYDRTAMTGIDRVAFGDRLFLEGSMLHISHDSLPLGAEIPDQLGFYERQKIANVFTSNEYWATPKDASNYHLAGYVTLDLTTIPELNP